MVDTLESFKIKRQKLDAKATEIDQELAKVKAKIAELDKAIFEREDGRMLKVIKKLMADKDPRFAEFSKMVRSEMERAEIGGVVKKGRPPKIAKTAPAAKG